MTFYYAAVISIILALINLFVLWVAVQEGTAKDPVTWLALALGDIVIAYCISAGF